jgi:hypothetical protein
MVHVICWAVLGIRHALDLIQSLVSTPLRRSAPPFRDTAHRSLKEKMKQKPSQKEIAHWEKWGDLAPFFDFLYGIVVFPIAGFIASLIFPSSTIGVGWGILTGIIWGAVMTIYSKKRMEAFRECESEPDGVVNASASRD